MLLLTLQEDGLAPTACVRATERKCPPSLPVSWQDHVAKVCLLLAYLAPVWPNPVLLIALKSKPTVPHLPPPAASPPLLLLSISVPADAPGGTLRAHRSAGFRLML